VTGMSQMFLSFPLFSTVGGGSGTVDLTKTILEVEGISEDEAMYPSPVLSGGLF
jgi:hypothetical protein